MVTIKTDCNGIVNRYAFGHRGFTDFAIPPNALLIGKQIHRITIVQSRVAGNIYRHFGFFQIRRHRRCGGDNGIAVLHRGRQIVVEVGKILNILQRNTGAIDIQRSIYFLHLITTIPPACAVKRRLAHIQRCFLVNGDGIILFLAMVFTISSIYAPGKGTTVDDYGIILRQSIISQGADYFRGSRGHGSAIDDDLISPGNIRRAIGCIAAINLKSAQTAVIDFQFIVAGNSGSCIFTDSITRIDALTMRAAIYLHHIAIRRCRNSPGFTTCNRIARINPFTKNHLIFVCGRHRYTIGFTTYNLYAVSRKTADAYRIFRGFILRHVLTVSAVSAPNHQPVEAATGHGYPVVVYRSHTGCTINTAADCTTADGDMIVLYIGAGR